MTCPQCKRLHPKVTKKVRDELILEHRALVIRTARKVHRSLPTSIELDDLISFGTFGLIRAIEHFDPASGVHFETYAISAIRGVIADELRSQDWAPRSLRKKQRLIAQTVKKLSLELNREPSIQELAHEAKLTVAEIESTNQAAANASHSSLDESRGESASHYDQIPDTTHIDPQAAASYQEIFILAARKLTHFSIQDQMVVMLYYHEMMTLREIGQVLGISESRASQLHVRVALEVREYLTDLLSA